MRFCLSSKWVSCGFIRVLFFFLSINCSLFSTSILSGQFFTGLFTPPHYSFFFFFTWIKSSQVTAFDDVMASHCCCFTVCISLLPFLLYRMWFYWKLWPIHAISNQINSIAIMHFAFFSSLDSIHHELNMECRNCSYYHHHYLLLLLLFNHNFLRLLQKRQFYHSNLQCNFQSTKINKQVNEKNRRKI